MDKLILQPTEISQWYALINEAQASARHILNESTESYLVYLLMRFSRSTQWVETIIAQDFLEAVRQSKHRKIELLRDVGDRSLLFCGLFPDTASRRNVDVNYFVSLGQAAYLYVGDLEEPGLGGLYHDLGQQFLILQKILLAIRPRSEFF